MTTPIQDIDFSTLSIAERIQIARDLLDSVLAETQSEIFTPAQLEEVDRRVAASDAGQIVGERVVLISADEFHRLKNLERQSLHSSELSAKSLDAISAARVPAEYAHLDDELTR